MWMVCFCLGMRATRWKPLKSWGNRWKTKTPPAGEAGGVLEKIDDLFQILNYLPASRVSGFLAKSGIVVSEMPASESSPHPGLPLRSTEPAHCDHRVGCERLIYVLDDCMAAEEMD